MIDAARPDGSRDAPGDLPRTDLVAAPPPTRGRLFRKYVALFVGVVFVALLVNVLFEIWFSYRDHEASLVRLQHEQAEAAAVRIDQFVREIQNELGWTTQLPWSAETLEQHRFDALRLLREVPAITELAQLDATGHERLRVSRLETDVIDSQADFSHDPKFTEAVAHKVWYGPVYFRRESEPYMTLAVAGARRDAGVSVAEVNLKLIWDVVSQIKVGEHGQAYVVDAKGRLIAHPDISLVLRDTDLAQLPQVRAAREEAPGAAEKLVQVVRDFQGREVLSAHALIAPLGWLVFVELPLDEAYAPLYASIERSAALLLAGLGLAFLAGLLLARRMVVPIRRLQESAERLGEGDLSQRIAIKTGDEIETLADRFNLMATRLQDSYTTLEAKVEERTHDLNQALQQQTATAEVLEVINASPGDLAPVFDAILEKAHRVCDVACGSLQIYDGERFRAVAVHGLAPPLAERLRQGYVPGPNLPNRRLVEGERIVHVRDMAEIDDPVARSVVELGGMRTLLCVALRKDETLLGQIVAARPDVRPFSEKEVELLESFAAQAVIAMENARLITETREALKQQTATADVLKVISRSAFDLNTVLDTLTRSAATLCNAETGIIRLRQGEVFRTEAVFGGSPAFLEHLKKTEIGPGRDSISARVALSGAVEHVVDLQADPEITQPGLPEVTPNRAALGVPLLREGKVEGIFVLGRTRPEPFTPRQIELVQTFADQAVIAIENARLFEEVQARTRELGRSLHDLRAAQDRLIQSEKMASLGQLTAGIAHEIKNPLNFVNNFASLSTDLLGELKELAASVASGADAATRADLEDIVQTLTTNLGKIGEHGRRADGIVKSMLLHSRGGSGEVQTTDLNQLIEEAMALAYHGLRAQDKSFNITMERDLDPTVGKITAVPQDVTRVFLNLIGNGFYAANKRKREGGEPNFSPLLKVTTRRLGDTIEIRVRDNGVGIPDEVRAKLFTPFFTTKPTGEGTGLGLSISYDIVTRGHGGGIDVESQVGAFTEFIVRLPRTLPQADKSESKGSEEQ